MTATVHVLDSNGAFRGAASNIAEYSLKADAFPMNPANLNGAARELTFDATEMGNSAYLYRSGVAFQDPDVFSGPVLASITSVEAQDGFLSISAVGSEEAAVAEVQIPPYAGSLVGALELYLEQIGVTFLVGGGGVPNPYVALPGGEVNLWEWLKELCAVYRVELYPYADMIWVVSPALTRTHSIPNVVSPQVAVQDGNLARSVEVNYYNNTHLENELVYPAGGWNEDVSVYQVEAGEVTEVDFETPVSIMWFDDPTAVDYVSSDYDGPTSVYAICGNDGLPVPPRLWHDEGGDLQLELLDDTTTLRLTLTGPRGTWAEEYGPFRVAMASGTGGSNTYSSLRVVGGGIFMHENTVTCPTGVPETWTAEEVGITIENRAIATRTQAYTAAVQAAQLYCGMNSSYGTSVKSVGSAIENTGVEGSRIDLGRAKYRVDSAAYNSSEVSLEATPWTTFEDLGETWGTGTFEEFGDEFGDLTFREFSLAPLRRLPE